MSRLEVCACTLALVAAITTLTSCGDESVSTARGTSSSGASTQAPGEVTPTPSPGDADDDVVQAVYYLGPGPDGPAGAEAALYRAFERRTADSYDTGSLLDLLTARPSDPDYRTMWARGSFRSVGDPEVGFSVVRLAGSVPQTRPPGMTAWEAELAIQQVVYSVRAYYREDVDVQFVQGEGRPVQRVFGVATDNGAVSAAPPLKVLSHMSITEPAEGQVVMESFTARGVNNGFEGTVSCELSTQPGSRQVWTGAGIGGWQEERLFPWELEVDLSGVPSGTYAFWCSTDDPTGGTEGAGAYVDTRTVVVE